MLFTTKWLATIFTSFQGDIEGTCIKHVSTDSRAQVNDALFVPLVGENFDGHEYIMQAVEHGAVAILWDKSYLLPKELPSTLPIYFVDDTLSALQQLAKQYKNKVNPHVIGITGSNGKTTTKDIINSVLRTTYKTHCTEGNLNNHIGVPLTILSMPKETEMLVLEMGMNDFGEIKQLSLIAEPDIAIITHIGESHIEFLGSREGIATAKLEILAGLKENGLLIVDGDEPLLQSIYNRKNVITCGFNHNSDAKIQSVHIDQNEMSFSLFNRTTYKISMLGRHHAKNATYAIILGEHLGINTKDIKEGLRNINLTSMRFELLTGKNGATIINDAYNASLTSMKAAIEVVKEMNGFESKTLILGDIFELGTYAEQFHKDIATVIDKPITALYTYGENAEIIAKAVKQEKPELVCNHFTDRETLINEVQPHLKESSLLLFKASRGMQFEKLVEQLL